MTGREPYHVQQINYPNWDLSQVRLSHTYKYNIQCGEI
jgi:hypothetical protein